MDKDQANHLCSIIGFPTMVICLDVSNICAIDRLTYKASFDDKRGAIDKRLKTWDEKTRHVADEFNAVIINAERSKDEVLAAVENKLRFIHNLI